MKSKELIRDFLTENGIEFHELHDSFKLTNLNISIPFEGMLDLPQMLFSVIAMEAGVNALKKLFVELEKLKVVNNTEGVKIYDFRKKETE